MAAVGVPTHAPVPCAGHARSPGGAAAARVSRHEAAVSRLPGGALPSGERAARATNLYAPSRSGCAESPQQGGCAALGSVQSATAYSVGVMLRYGVCYVTAYSRVRVRDTANTSVRRNITRIVVFPPVRVKSRFDGLALYSRCGCRSSRARCVRAPCRVRAIAVRLRRLPTVAWSHAAFYSTNLWRARSIEAS